MLSISKGWRWLPAAMVALGVFGCRSLPRSNEVLFGRPNAKTGLTKEACQPRCSQSCRDGKTGWQAPEYSDSDIAKLGSFVLVNPPSALAGDPYETMLTDQAPSDGSREQNVCAVVRESPNSKRYRLKTFASRAEAGAVAAITTHFGACGACSSLKDLSVYLSQNDLVAPVRSCALHNATSHEDNVQCLLMLGFTRPCAEIWAYNSRNTRRHCLFSCLLNIWSSYHDNDHSLNACLACDERESGPVFKAVAGRTRRNTGTPNAICRPSSEVQPLVHQYGP